MAIFKDLTKLPDFRKPVLTIGSFDGVHEGHQVILKKVASLANSIGGESILITFNPHPRKILHPDQELGLLTDPEQKIKLITSLGIDHIIMVPFTRDFSLLSAKEYVTEFLIKHFHPHTIVLGYDHHFGHSREGDIHLLKKLVKDQINIEEIPAQLIEAAAVSSTKIRVALSSGHIKEANEMLGRPYSFKASVIHGSKLGRKLGFPTANLQLKDPDVLLPKPAVYAVLVAFNEKVYKGMMSIGYRPTITDKKDLTLEVNILDFSEDIYGKFIEVSMIAFIRNEEKYESLERLIQQLKDDEEKTRLLLE